MENIDRYNLRESLRGAISNVGRAKEITRRLAMQYPDQSDGRVRPRAGKLTVKKAYDEALLIARQNIRSNTGFALRTMARCYVNNCPSNDQGRVDRLKDIYVGAVLNKDIASKEAFKAIAFVVSQLDTIRNEELRNDMANSIVLFPQASRKLAERVTKETPCAEKPATVTKDSLSNVRPELRGKDPNFDVLEAA